MKKIFLEELPKWGIGGCGREGTIKWGESIGCKVRGIYDDINFEVEIVDYIKNEQKLYIKWEGKFNKISTDHFKDCKLGKLFGKITSDFKIEIGTHFKDNKRDVIVTDRKYIKDKYGKNRKYYKYKCNNCGFECGEHYKNGEYKEEYLINESHLLKGCGCACCCHTPKIVVEGINDIPTTVPWMVKYFQGGYDEAKMYTYKSNKRITPICPDCGRIKDTNKIIGKIYSNRSIGCNCSDGKSYPEKFIYSILEQLKINFKIEVKYKWNKYQTFDGKSHQASIDFIIYYNNREIPLEADGGFHRKDNVMNGQTKEESKYIDKQRDDNCLKYLGEETIRIIDEGDIRENILNSKLNKIFDLSKIDWNKCEEFALKNLVKEICEYWNNKEDWETATNLANIFKLDRSIIRDYLKKGNKLGWCNYNPKEEDIKNRKNIGKNNGKRVEVLKEGVSLGIFPSCSELDRNSEDIFGVKLNFGNVSAVCIDIRKKYKGFTFKYIEDNKNCA